MRIVTILQARLVHYRVPLFEKMREECARNDIQLHVVHGFARDAERTREDSGTLPWAESVRTRVLTLGGRELLWQVLPKSVLNSDLIVIGQHNRELLNYWLLMRSRFRGPLVAYWGHGRNFQSENPDGIAERWKARISRHSDWWFAYNDVSRHVVESFGYPPDRITSLDNSTDTRAFEAELHSIRPSEIIDLKASLGLPAGATVGLYCGSLTSDKRLAYLIKSVVVIRQSIPDFHLVIVGAGPLQPFIEEAASRNTWIKWAGPKRGRAKATYYRIAQVLLNPGSVGLSILDALCAGLPLITTKMARHGPEISYLLDGQTGLIVAGDESAYAVSVIELLRHQSRYQEICGAARIAASTYSIEAMAANFVSGILACLSRFGRVERPTGARTVECHPSTPDTRAAHVSARRKPARIAFLTNFIPPYRREYFTRLNELTTQLKILLSTRMESNRSWPTEWGDLDVSLQHCLSFSFTRRHPSGYSEPWFIHLPWDTVPRLIALNPAVVISAELGARTMQAAIFRWFYRDSRFIVYADLCERTEVGRGWITRAFRRFLLKQADMVIVNGGSGRRYIESLGVRADKIVHLPYATDTATFGRTAPRKPVGFASRLIHVGQLIERKGVIPFVHILFEWATSNPDRELSLELVGDGPLRSILAAMDVPKNLRLTVLGNVPYERLPEAYGRAEIMVIPTLADTWALVVNEAMACGLPILGSMHSQAVEELVTDGKTGWTFLPESRESVRNAIERALSASPEELHAMGVRAREVAMALTPEYVARKTQIIVDESLGECVADRAESAS